MTDIEKVRLLARDKTTRYVNNVEVSRTPFLSDTEWQFCIDEEGGDIRCAAALGLETFAADAARVAKSQSSGGVCSSSKDLIVTMCLEVAKRLREQSELEPYAIEVESAVYPWDPVNRALGDTVPYDI